MPATEAEWLASDDPQAMIWGLRDLANLRNKRNHRRLRLFAVACCHCIRHLLEEPDAVRALDLAERFADGRSSGEEMLAASSRVSRIHSGMWDAYQAVAKTSGNRPTYTFRRQYVNGPDYLAACAVWRSVLWEQIKADPDPPDQKRPNAVAISAKQGERVVQAGILRDIFNPFRPGALDPAWLRWNGGTIPALAQTSYDDRELPSGHLDATRLALLADALEDAGCSDAAILEHLRGCRGRTSAGASWSICCSGGGEGLTGGQWRDVIPGWKPDRQVLPGGKPENH